MSFQFHAETVFFFKLDFFIWKTSYFFKNLAYEYRYIDTLHLENSYYRFTNISGPHV